mmetsp:Transcript_35618/g.83429  ORF Transcript_35618/g.83429 Transcript_35618/m.83429 type:complete len:253 (+) Transcript_35618:188-946(+)
MAAREGVHVSSLNLPLWFWSRHVMTPSRCPRPTTPTTVLQPFTAIELFIVSDRKTSLSRMRGSTTLGRSSASCASYTSTLLAISPTCSCSSVRLLFANMVLPTNWAALHFSSLSMPLQHLSSVISTGLSPNTICAPQSSPAALAALKSTPTWPVTAESWGLCASRALRRKAVPPPRDSERIAAWRKEGPLRESIPAWSFCCCCSASSSGDEAYMMPARLRQSSTTTLSGCTASISLFTSAALSFDTWLVPIT